MSQHTFPTKSQPDCLSVLIWFRFQQLQLEYQKTRRLELWNNPRGMWFDHREHMEEDQEKNKEWENFWWTVDEDMFTYVMKSKIEELIEEKLNQEFPEEVETRGNQGFESDEEMTSETEVTEYNSEPNNENVNTYLDSANMATNLESAMKIAEEEDLWIGDSGASSHMMGSEEHVFNRKLIFGSMRLVLIKRDHAPKSPFLGAMSEKLQNMESNTTLHLVSHYWRAKSLSIQSPICHNNKTAPMKLKQQQK